MTDIMERGIIMKIINRIPTTMGAIALTALLTVPAIAADPVKEATKVQTQIKTEAKQLTSDIKKTVPNTVQVNINTASSEQLQTLIGVGAAKAQAIIDYRTQNGKFKAVDDLMNVPGIGTKLIEQNRHLLKF